MIEKLIEAGEILKKVRKKYVNEEIYGMKFLDLCEKIEKEIIKLGGKPAFPVNISIDEVAAHDTALPKDERKIEGKLVKVDFGVQIDGWIVDSSVTLVFDKKYEILAKASKEALERAIDIIKPGIKIREIGRVIEETIKEYGFKPIYNLTGHQIERYNLHGKISIPNYDNKNERVLEEGVVIAIEPFATNGSGFVIESGYSGILRLERYKKTRIHTLNKIIDFIRREYNGLPFAERWLYSEFEEGEVRVALRLGVSNNILHVYPRLVEGRKGVVSQFEHTVIVHDPPIILT